MSAEVSIDFDFKKIRKVFNEEFEREFDYIFMHFFKGEIDRYTPFLTGQLVNTAYIPQVISAKEGAMIVYPTIYARRIYFGDDFKFTIDSHPQARARWEQAISSSQIEDMIEKAANPIFDKYVGRSRGK